MSLGIACAQCEAFYGAGWYWNPPRWGTSDGYVPFPVLWDAWRAMQSVQAWQRLSMSSAVALGQPVSEEGRDKRERAVKEQEWLAFPTEGATDGQP